MTQGSTGSATPSTSTESFVVLHLLEKNSEVFVERDTGTTNPGHQGGQTGRGTRPSLCAVIVEGHRHFGICFFYPSCWFFCRRACDPNTLCWFLFP
ncbi:hypothetical protein Leryth_008132 [Lithospermum erythrorhizon]|nr:hypothetical protein Leryth_008132 [Lithospermum erythrorhizon]